MEVVKQKYPGLTHNRIPVCNSAAPLEADFDTIVNCLLGTNVNAPVIVNCQVMGYYTSCSNITCSPMGASLCKVNCCNIRP